MPGRVNSPACRLPDFRRRSGCVPAEPYPPLKRPRILQTKNLLTIGPEHYSAFVRTDLSGFDRTTTVESSGEKLGYAIRVEGKRSKGARPSGLVVTHKVCRVAEAMLIVV